MKVCEEFVTVQGEGKYVGVPSFFIRTVGCGLRCAWKNEDGSITKCDTEYTSFYIEGSYDFNIDSFKQNFIDKYPNINHIVITGGEPLLQKDLVDVIMSLKQIKSFVFTIETNGTIYNQELTRLNNVLFSFSPKLLSSYYAEGNDLEIHKKNNHFLTPIEKYLDNSITYQVKYVINEQSDFDQIQDLNYLGLDNKCIYLMPQGIDSNTLSTNLKKCIDFCLENGYNITDRLHIRIFGNKRKT